MEVRASIHTDTWSVSRCRELLGDAYRGQTDEEIMRLRDALQEIARIFCDLVWLDMKKAGKPAGQEASQSGRRQS